MKSIQYFWEISNILDENCNKNKNRTSENNCKLPINPYCPPVFFYSRILDHHSPKPSSQFCSNILCISEYQKLDHHYDCLAFWPNLPFKKRNADKKHNHVQKC